MAFNPIINRYVQILVEKNPEFSGGVSLLKPLEGDETNDLHLLWMLDVLIQSKSNTSAKNNRWLGYIQGIMVSKGYINVSEERNLTRPHLAHIG